MRPPTAWLGDHDAASFPCRQLDGRPRSRTGQRVAVKSPQNA